MDCLSIKTIIVTGTPGTGKTVVAKRIAKQKHYAYLDVKTLIKNFKLNKKYDRKRKTWLVDVDRLNKALVSVVAAAKIAKAKGIVIDSHLAHYLPKRYVDLCIVTRTEPKKLYPRLKKRKYSKLKIDENMEAEIMQVILEEARSLKHNIKVVWT